MRSTGVIIICFFFLTIISCKKKEKETDAPKTPVPASSAKKIDTIKPLPYLPIYPGSYWKYSNGNTLTTPSHYVKDAYTLHYLDNNYRYATYQSDTFYVALSGSIPVWGYMAHNDQALQQLDYARPQPFVRIVSDSIPVGSGWVTQYHSHEMHWAKIMAKDTTIVIEGKNYYPTIVLLYSWSYNNGTVFNESKSYFTKDIGIVKTESLGDSGKVTGESHIVDYFINK